MSANPTWGGSEPAGHAFAVTPNDSAELSYITRALYVGGAGSVAVVTAQGDAVTFVGVTAGSVLPVRVRKVNATGTSATNIVGLY